MGRALEAVFISNYASPPSGAGRTGSSLSRWLTTMVAAKVINASISGDTTAGGRSRLPALLALCREEEPEVEIRFFEVPLSQQIKG